MKTTISLPQNIMIINMCLFFALLTSCSPYSKMATRWHYRHEFRQIKVSHTYHISFHPTTIAKVKA